MIEVQLRDTLIIFDVPGHESQVMRDGGCSNEDIKVTNNVACSSQLPSDLCEPLGDGFCQEERISDTQKTLKNLLCLFWIASIVNPFVNFPKRDKTNADPLGKQRRKEFSGMGLG